MMLYLFRALAELGFYYAFAGIALTALGAQAVLPALLILGACFALAAALHERGHRIMSAGALALAAAFAVLPGVNWADRALYLPPLAYSAWLVFGGRVQPDRYQSIDVFSVFWKAYGVAVPVLLLVGCGGWLMTGSVSAALVCVTASAVLLRTLRHAPETRRQWPVQVMNLASLGGVLAAAWLLSLRQTLDAVGDAVGLIWRVVFQPILLAIAALTALLVGWIYYLFRWLLSLMDGQVNDLNMNMENGSGLPEKVEEIIGAEPNTLLPLILRAVGIIAVITGLILFFRWMAGRRAPEQTSYASQDAEGMLDLSGHARGRAMLPGTPAGRVRTQYRRFLRLCRNCGISPAPCHTSLDIETASSQLRSNEDAASELRALYLTARYGEGTTAVDAARARELYHQIKAQMKPHMN